MKGHLFIMEEIKNASISINLSEGNINISGSEEFVEKYGNGFAFVERANNIKKVKQKKVVRFLLSLLRKSKLIIRIKTIAKLQRTKISIKNWVYIV